MHKRQILVLVTALFAVASIGAAWIYHPDHEPIVVQEEPRRYPTVGQGDVELVLFEDLRCVKCGIFTEQVYPQIAAEYIETGRARFTIVPLAFLEGSKPLANAALGVYAQSPDLFFLFVHQLFKSGAAGKQQILSIARKMGGIDLDDLAQCMQEMRYDGVLDENLKWAKEKLGPRFGTPTLLINGVRVSTSSFEEIALQITKAEKRR